MGIIRTNIGELKFELFDKLAANTVANFLSYVEKGWYKEVLFHRCIAGFMIQTGLVTYDGEGLNRIEQLDPIKLENPHGNVRGAMAMARHGDPDSATSEFFINVAHNRFLDASDSNPGYSVFGKITEGMNIADAISLQPTQRFGGMTDIPKTLIKIEEIVL